MAGDGSRLTVIELDHVLFAVGDLDAAARRLEVEHGLPSVEGGRHPGWGTENRIVPLGDTYVELIAVADEAEAAESLFGRWVASGGRDRPLGWAVRTDQLDAVAARLGLTVDAGARVTPGGAELRWRTAGKEEAIADPALPFFIEWDAGTVHPGLAGPANARLVRLEIAGDASRLGSWLGDRPLPIIVRPGAPALESVVLARAGAEIVL